MSRKVALTVYFDEQSGEVDQIECTKRFEHEGALFKIDVIKDAIEALTSIYQYERSKFFNDFNDIGEA